MEFGIAVKALVINENKEILIIKRRSNDVHAAGKWEIPGGRLDPGESPFTGLEREVDEEVGLKITFIAPLKIDHFTREDGQVITMIIFLCEKIDGEICLSEEHTDYKWISKEEIKKVICKEFHATVDAYEKYFLD